MHEVSIMQSALESAERHALAQGATRIHRIVLRIGAASGVEPDALEFAFEPVTRGSMADGATLEIVQVATICFCRTCQTEFQPEDLIHFCPACQTPALDLLKGMEMELASLEVS
jgi:hydrogenase nickel incorporation protein HypA/HybF